MSSSKDVRLLLSIQSRKVMLSCDVFSSGPLPPHWTLGDCSRPQHAQLAAKGDNAWSTGATTVVDPNYFVISYREFFFSVQYKTPIQYKTTLTRTGAAKIWRDLVTMTTHHKIGRTLVILAQEWEVEVQQDGYRNCSFDPKEPPRPSTSSALPSVTFPWNAA